MYDRPEVSTKTTRAPTSRSRRAKMRGRWRRSAQALHVGAAGHSGVSLFRCLGANWPITRQAKWS